MSGFKTPRAVGQTCARGPLLVARREVVGTHASVTCKTDDIEVPVLFISNDMFDYICGITPAGFVDRTHMHVCICASHISHQHALNTLQLEQCGTSGALNRSAAPPNAALLAGVMTNKNKLI